MKKCNKKVCNVCGAPFEQNRGCFLEKKCPACRFLYGGNGHETKTNKKMLLALSPELAWEYYPTEWIEGRKAKFGDFVFMTDDDAAEIGGIDICEDICQEEETEMFLGDIRKMLSASHYRILMDYFGVGGSEKSVVEISQERNLSKTRIHQIIDTSIRLLKVGRRRRIIFDFKR